MSERCEAWLLLVKVFGHESGVPCGGKAGHDGKHWAHNGDTWADDDPHARAHYDEKHGGEA